MQLSIEEVKKLDSNSYQIIDIRSEEEVAHGAIKGALNIQMCIRDRYSFSGRYAVRTGIYLGF